jgi:hypothetical protein
VETTSEEENVSTASRYPEHEKLSKVKDASQKCGEFLDWLRERYTLAQYHEHVEACYEPEYDDIPDSDPVLVCGTSTHILYAAPVVPTKLLAEFFEIDEVKLDVEKQTMLDDIRKAQRR